MGIEMNSSEIISNGGSKTDIGVITDQVALTLGTDMEMGPIVSCHHRSYTLISPITTFPWLNLSFSKIMKCMPIIIAFILFSYMNTRAEESRPLSRLPDMFNLGEARMEFVTQHCSIQR
jgi:hypothetical protein